MKNPPATPESAIAFPDDSDAERRVRQLLQRQAILERENRELLAALNARIEESGAILNALPAQIALIDAEGRIVAVNDKWVAFAKGDSAKGPESFIGLNYLDICGAGIGDCGEESHSVAVGLSSVLSGRQPSFTREYPCHSREGRRWFRLMVTPVSGIRSAGAVVIHVDVTERKISEEHLREERARLAGLFDAAMDAIVTVDESQVIVRVNPAAEAMFGYAASQILGQPLGRLIPERFGASHAEDVTAFGVNGSSRRMGSLGSVWGVRSDGREFPVEASISQVAVGGTKFYTAILRDVTARRKAEAEQQRTGEQMRALARRLEVIRDEQAAHIARELHDELGQTLTVVKLHVSAMQKQLDSHPNRAPSKVAEEAIGLIDDSVANLRRLCTELRPPMLDHLSLGSALTALASDFQAHSGIACTLDVPAGFPVLDPTRQTTIYRLVQELLTNVARHSGASTVRILLREAGNTIKLEVSDNGRGIAESELAGTKSLGLLGMRERALAAGGTINFEGQPGKGTTAIAFIPPARQSKI